MRNRSSRRLLIAALVLLNAAALRPAHAQITNGSFETGNFTGYSTTGFTEVRQFTTSPVNGGTSFQVTPTNGTYGGLAGTDGINGGPVATTTLETFFGLSSGAFNAARKPGTDPNALAREGSGIKQTFTTTGAGTLTFDIDFLTNELPPVHDFQDYGFYTLGNGTTTTLTNFADVFSPLTTIPGDAGRAYDSHTGFQTITISLLGPGTYTVGFGAVDVDVTNGSDLSSAVFVDNLRFTASPSANVPEPAFYQLSVLSVGGGLSLLAMRRCARRK